LDVRSNQGAKHEMGGHMYFEWEDRKPLAPCWRQPWVKFFSRICWSSLQHMGHETPVL